MEHLVKAINLLCHFLSDVSYSQNDVVTTDRDLCVLLGNSSLKVVDSALDFFNKSNVHNLVISGGIGHSTNQLINNINEHTEYKSIFNDCPSICSEAELIYLIAKKAGKIESSKKFFLEMKSTNTGENAIFSKSLLFKESIAYDRIILFEDPLLQRRARATFEKNFPDSTIVSFTTFVPSVYYQNKQFLYTNPEYSQFCSIDRLFELIAGEIPRLTNDANGYGPIGKNFISRVETPGNVLKAYSLFKTNFPEYSR